MPPDKQPNLHPVSQHWLTKSITFADRAVSRLEDATALFVLAGMVCCVFLEVIFRYVLNAPLAWTEELARLSLIWLTFAGGAIVFRDRMHIRIEMVVDMLPGPIRALLLWLTEIGVLLVLLVLVASGLAMTMIFWSSKLPVVEIPVGFVYLPVPLFCSTMLLHWVTFLIRGEMTSLPSHVIREAESNGRP